jgi:4-hydroxythreonine-4-phosphate dehydrogenase
MQEKPVIGVSIGDINGIGPEIIIKTFSDNRVIDICTPVIFASNKIINFYRKAVPESNFNFQSVKELNKLNPKQANVYNCWEDEVSITPGQITDTGGKYAVKSLMFSAQMLKEGKIDALVTAPIHKKNIQGGEFQFTGHTPFLKSYFNAPDVLMLMTAENMRVGLVTEHVPLSEVAKNITRENIQKKLVILNQSLQKDFGIDKPRIALLGLNPHAGDEGLIGKEEEEIIKPLVKDARRNNIFAFGPYSADAFFARGSHQKFDGVLAMYHDQGLIPFKSLAMGEGVNYTAGLNVVRTSPDHGTAFDIAGKNKADESSFRESIFRSIDILRNRREFEENHKNPLKKMSSVVVANAEDEKIEDESNGD